MNTMYLLLIVTAICGSVVALIHCGRLQCTFFPHSGDKLCSYFVCLQFLSGNLCPVGLCVFQNCLQTLFQHSLWISNWHYSSSDGVDTLVFVCVMTMFVVVCIQQMQVQLIVRQSSTQQMVQGSIRQLSLASCEYTADTQTSTVKSQVSFLICLLFYLINCLFFSS